MFDINDSQSHPVRARSAEPAAPLVVRVYRGSLSSFRVGFKNGVVAHFVNYLYRTNRPDQIAELDEMVEMGRLTLETEQEVWDGDDPLASLRARIIAEYEANRKEVKIGHVDGGSVGVERLKPMSTSDMPGGAASSVSLSGGGQNAPAPQPTKMVVKTAAK